MRAWKECSEPFYSNCLLEMLKHKLKNWSKVEIIVVPVNRLGSLFPHFMWSDGENDYDFGTTKAKKWYEVIWFEGQLRQWKLGHAKRLKKLSILQKQRKH